MCASPNSHGQVWSSLSLIFFVSALVSPAAVVSYSVRVVWNLFPSLAGGFSSFVLFRFFQHGIPGEIAISWEPSFYLFDGQSGGFKCPFSSFQNYDNVHARNSLCEVSFWSTWIPFIFPGCESCHFQAFPGLQQVPLP